MTRDSINRAATQNHRVCHAECYTRQAAHTNTLTLQAKPESARVCVRVRAWACVCNQKASKGNDGPGITSGSLKSVRSERGRAETCTHNLKDNLKKKKKKQRYVSLHMGATRTAAADVFDVPIPSASFGAPRSLPLSFSLSANDLPSRHASKPSSRQKLGLPF